MDISYKWLKRFISFDLAPKELAAALTSIGLECDTVEEIETIRGGLRGVVIGKVLTCEDHPNSDHLHITTVDLGEDAPVQIVCGAPNVAAGQTVVVATVGTTLYNGDEEFKIKKSKIRGTESFGMICAEDEIGIGTDHAGIMVLPEGAAAPGTPASEYFKIDSDYRLEVELTPNRVDAASHYGVARDLKAYLAARDFENCPESAMPEVTCPDANAFHIDRPDGAATVEVVDKDGCARYSGVTIRGVKVGQSPDWLKNLLIAAGQRPINNVVDVTNFVLLGLGQPLHSFDLGKVKDEKIVVRTCEPGTKFTTLDGVEHELHESDLMICDAEKPMCIAGVFGGLDSGVTEATTDIFLESAYFNPTRVRRSARRHGLSTDASFRYERGADPEITVYAAKVAAVMIQELAGGEICGEIVDITANPPGHAKVDLSLDYCARLIGKDLPRPLIETILKALDIRILPGSEGDVLHLDVPPFRVDVTRPCDVVEEILRIYGYNNVEFGMEMHANLGTRSIVDTDHAMRRVISEQLTGEGFLEIMNNSLTSLSYFENNEDMPAELCVKIINPLSGDLALMRPTLLYGGLEAASRNINRKATDLKLYEFGNIYAFDPDKPATDEAPLAPYSERTVLGLWCTGNSTAASWNTKAAETTIFDLKASVEKVIRRMGADPTGLKANQDSDATFSALLSLYTPGGKLLAKLGLVRKEILKRFDISQPLSYAEINWKELVKLASKATVKFAPPAKTLPVRRDLALLLDAGVSFEAVAQAVRKAERKLLQGVVLFDVYEGDKLPEGKKSYAIAITLQDPEKTLNDKQIDSSMNRIISTLQQELGAELR